MGWLRLVSVATLACCSTVLWAADVADSQDLELLPRFPRAQIVDFRQSSGQERVFPAAPVQRISGRTRIEKQVRSQGQLTALTYALPAEHSASEAFTAAREHLQTQGAQLLYWCRGRDCGASSLWANTVFDDALLNGGDDQQTYALMRLTVAGQDQLVALYAVTRGNRRAYLHVEQLNASAPLGELLPNSATLLKQLKSSGQLALDVPAPPSPQWVTLLARSLSMDSTLRVSLSGPQADAWQAALNAKGIRASRMQVEQGSHQGLLIKVLRD
jgi:hypothetical protein